MKNKILHILEDISIESGGLRTMITSLNAYINESNSFKSSILTLKKEELDNYKIFSNDKLKFWHYSKELAAYLYAELNSGMIPHLHGVWMHPQYVASKISSQKKVPYVITAHGMLEPLLLNDKKFKKSIYLKIFLENILKNAKYIHAITPMEKNNLYSISKNKNIIEIPNLIHFNEAKINLEYNPKEEYILFLGRFHTIKGIEMLIEAFNQISDKNIKLYLVGFENEYSISLKNLTEKYNLSHRIYFYGKAVGEDKLKLFSNAKAFVAPSFSEVIGMVNLEAAKCKTPVITTFNTGLNPEWNSNGGIMINPTTDELIKALNEACSWSQTERIERGIRLYDYVYENYSWEKKGHLWNEFYNLI